MSQGSLNYGTVIEHIPEGVITADSSGIIRQVNRTAESMFGYSSGQMEGKPVSIIIPGDLRAAHLRGLRHVASGGELHGLDRTMKLRGLRSDGVEFPVEISLSHWSRDAESYFTAVVRESAAPQSDGDAASLERAYFEELFQSSPEAIVLVDIESRVLRLNREFTRLFGYTPEDLIGKSVDLALAPEEMRAEAGAFTTRVAMGERLSVNTVRKSKDGRLIDVSLLAAPVFTEQGQVATYAIYRDITDQRKAETELRQSEARYKNIFHSASVSIWEEDLTSVKASLDELKNQGVEDFAKYFQEHPEFVQKTAEKITVLDVNDATLDLYEAESRAELLGPLNSKVIEEHLSVFANEFVAIAEGRPFFETEVAARTLRGQPIDLVVKMAIPRDSERFSNVLVNIVDVSQRRRVEEALQRAQRLESLGLMGGALAHEFNNILVSILGNAELAQLELPEGSPARKMLAEIGTAVNRAAALTDEMLAFSGRAKVDIKPLDISSEVRGMRSAIEAIKPENAVIQYDLAEELPYFLGDAARIKQTMLGLVSNATEALRDGDGTIGVATGLTKLTKAELQSGYWTDELDVGTYLFLRVSDTGHGMDRDTLPRAFDPFFTTKFAGRGLGLAAVLGIVRSMGGAVKVISAPDRGTTVTLFFPASGAEGEDSESPERDYSNWRGEGEILVVDDERSVLSVTKRVLRRWGFTVLTADDGTEGVEIYRNHCDKLKAVLLDFMMPIMRGDAAFAEMRRIDPRVPIVLLSGYAEGDGEHGLPFEGPDAFIHKPFELTELFETLVGVLEPHA
ncbi:MAG: PAS domain S-box protein [Gemmatimonadales bacterium]